MGQRLVRARRNAHSPFVQALGYSWMNRVGRAGSTVPVALTVRTEPGLRVEPGEPWFYRGLKAPVATDPLRITKFDHLALWRTNEDARVTAWANWLAVEAFRGGIPVVMIAELNPGERSHRSMLRQLMDLRTVGVTSRFTEQRNLLVAIDPHSPLPLLLAQTWPSTRVVVIMTRQPAFEVTELHRVDALLIHESLGRTELAELDVPFLAGFTEREQAAAQLKALASGGLNPVQGYFFTIRGEISALGSSKPTDAEDLIIGVPGSGLDHAAGCRTFRDFFAKVLADAQVIAVHSRFLYTHETMIEASRIEDLLFDLVARGARVRFVSMIEPGRRAR